jgi:hypothetical protein
MGLAENERCASRRQVPIDVAERGLCDLLIASAHNAGRIKNWKNDDGLSEINEFVR